MFAERVQRIIEESLPGSQALIRDFTGTGDHLEANVIWPGFAGLSKVQQHRKVYETLQHLVGDGLPIHAISLKTWVAAPSELDSPADAYFGD